MKLKELAIEGPAASHPVHLGTFSDGLTLVYGENLSGKSQIAQFVTSALLDDSAVNCGNGRLGVKQQSLDYTVHKTTGTPTRVQSFTGSPDASFPLSQLTMAIDPELYQTTFNFNLKHSLENAGRLANALNRNLGVPFGPEAAGDNSRLLAWEKEASSLRQQQATLANQLETLQREKQQLVGQIDSQRVSRQARLSDVESQINHLLVRIQQLQAENYQEDLSRVDTEIAQLRLVIENSKTTVAHIPSAPKTDLHHSLYQRLDEIDDQIRRWRHVQTDIQQQRVRLRDEMLIWNELTLDSDAHPYHNARSILIALESKVDQTERHARHWAEAGAVPRVDTQQLAESIGQLCHSMREHLYSLCDELGQQYKHIRHRAAAGELKQLRRSYTEMGESIERLVAQRDLILKEIRAVDPAGAAAIVRAELNFCQCAQHEGYLRARQKFVGELNAPIQPNYEVIQQNVDAERARLVQLEQQRVDLINRIAAVEGELNQLNQQHASCVAKRDSILVESVITAEETLQRVNSEIIKVTSVLEDVTRRLESGPALVAPNPLVQRACVMLSGVTQGDLTEVFLSNTGVNSELVVRDRVGKVLSLSAIAPPLQDLGYLCLALAAVEEVAKKGTQLPVLIDDTFQRIGSDRVTAALNLLNEFANRGHQVIAMTQHRYLADRLPGVAVLEIAPTNPSSPVITEPVRRSTPIIPAAPLPASPLPAAPPRENNWEVENGTVTDQFYSSMQPRSYPLSKYPRNKPDFREDRSYTIAYPFNLRDQGTDQFESEMRTASRRPSVLTRSVSLNEAIPAVEIGPSVDDQTQLDKVGLFDIRQLQAFWDAGIELVGDLLAVDPESNQYGFHPDQLDQWQSQIWLLSTIPGLRVNDARVLVRCGVTDPEQLETSHAEQVLERVNRFLASMDGKRFVGAEYSVSLDRISGWRRGVSRTRSRWGDRNRQSYRRRPRAYREREREVRRYEPREIQPHSQSTRRREPRPERQSRERAGRLNERYQNRDTREVHESNEQVASVSNSTSASPKPKATKSRAKQSGAAKLKFYLDLSDHIEAAPSIGPKTAERFEKIGVVTVAEFLKQTAESMATKINYKRISAPVIRQWQQQARLVCRIPNLRGHDAQLLVACNVTEPEELSTMQPKALFDVVGPFSETKEGLKIIRNGKKPDLEEITDWITWAADTRSLQAA